MGRELKPEFGFFEDVQQGNCGPATIEFFLQLSQLFRFWLRLQRRQANPPVASRGIVHFGIGGQPRIKLLQCLGYVLLNLGDEGFNLQGLLQVLIIGRSLGLKVLWQILIWIALAFGSIYPEFLTAQFISDGLEHAQFIRNPVNLRFAVLFSADRDGLPGGIENPFNGRYRQSAGEHEAVLGTSLPRSNCPPVSPESPLQQWDKSHP